MNDRKRDDYDPETDEEFEYDEDLEHEDQERHGWEQV